MNSVIKSLQYNGIFKLLIKYILSIQKYNLFSSVIY